MNTKFFFILLFLLANSLYSQNRVLDSLQTIINKNKTDTNQVNALTTFAALVKNADIQKAIDYNTKALTLAKKTNYEKGIAQSELNYGTINHIQGNYDTALVYYKLALTHFTQINNIKGIAKCHNNLGNLYQLKAEYNKAIEELLICKRLGEQLKNDKMLADCGLNMGNVYLQKKEYNEALKHYDYCLEHASKINDLVALSQVYNNKGAAQRLLTNTDSALTNYRRSLQIRYLLNDVVGIPENILNIGDVFSTLNKEDSALVYFQKSYQLYGDVGHKTGMAYSLNNIGSSLGKLKKYDASLDTLYKVVKLATEIGLRDLKLEAYKNIVDILNKQGKYKECVEYMAEMASLKDSLLNEANNRSMTEMQEKYESEKKDKEIVKQTAEIKNQQIEGEQRTTQRNAFIVGFVLVLLLALFIFRGYQQKQKANEVIEAQKKEVEQQKEIIEEKQKEIVDSINYAKRIQYTLLAHTDFLKTYLPEHFVYFNPKDIVSGDFYWAAKVENKFYLAVCDSTGHGVPGAFMSLLNIGFLSEAINEKGIEEPHKVLDYVRKRLIEAVNKDNQKDGFDGILLCFDLVAKKITYAAAHNAPVLVSNGGLKVLPADKMPVGIGERKEEFTLYSIHYIPGDSLYLYTDGYADQFGGPKGKKFKYKQLDELLVTNCHLPLHEQAVVLQTTFQNWKGNLEQVDDVCMIGIKL